MKRITYLIIAVIVLIIASYVLYDNVISPSFRRTVIQIDDTTVLVVTDTKIQIEGEPTEELIRTYMNDSIWFYTSENQLEDIKIGDRVKVKAGNVVETSLPPRMDAIEINKLR
ncbi:DUF3221 domain-containing protein [Halalkalibacter nanhaiisediminis]|uniref:Uncharacterized protein DUF3221 n=1 Tax=Halalkalibacter nanhaiisediminis TaxID=688079 RepID=A0A562QT97_9BACI|nr:DUF3221 domain-containing protein [Halalkalibacter nanhaiisediminis]TWI59296.1 uncharacterized protein DUF3221 [Halalkalibacter nanhaiisediminis]